MADSVPKNTLYEDVVGALGLQAKGVKTKERRYFTRSLRRLHILRKRMTVEVLTQVANEFYPQVLQYTKLCKATPVPQSSGAAPMDLASEEKEKPESFPSSSSTSSSSSSSSSSAPKEPTAEEIEKERKKKEEQEKEKAEWRNLPEVQAYIHLSVALLLLDNNQYDDAAQTLTPLFEFVQVANRRTLDSLSAKVFYYYSLAFEKKGQLTLVRNNLLLAHRTACRQHNEFGEAALICSILRNFLAAKLYTQADKFRLNCNFPESRSNNLHARYLYYIGLICAIQLHYSDAFSNLSQAIRKAPQTHALGFRTRANQLLVIVQLLMGEIPERVLFSQSDLQTALLPYFHLTQAVRVGDIAAFGAVMSQYEKTFVSDGLYSLVTRLHHNVIKTGLRKISLSYSRISLADIATKLQLDGEEEAEHIVAKAITDGVIEAVIDRKQRFLFSKENPDVYSTNEPQGAFHKRIQFCLDLHNDAVKALRFPPGSHKPQSEKDREEQDRLKEGNDEEEISKMLDEDENDG